MKKRVFSVLLIVAMMASTLAACGGKADETKAAGETKAAEETKADVYKRQEGDSLYQAQVNKVDRILEKLYLKEGMTLLDRCV